MKQFLRVLCIFLTGVFISCGGGGDGGETLDADQNGEKSQLSQSALKGFTSDAELETYLKEGLQAVSSESAYKNEGLQLPATTADESDAGGNERFFSGTNLQETGVDEADTMKTDGEFLYIIRPASTAAPVFYTDAAAEKVSKKEAEETESSQENAEESIRVVKLYDDPPGTELVREIPLKEVFKNHADGLYLLTDREGDRPDLLAAVSGLSDTVWIDWFCPWCWSGGETEVAFFNVDDPLNPQFMKVIRLDGQLISSRRIGSQLYLVTRYTPDLTGYTAYPSTAAEKEENQAVLEKTPLSDLLPRISIDEADQGALVLSSQCYLPPGVDDKTPDPTMITVTAIDLDNPENLSSQTITGSTETLYASAGSLYLASTKSPSFSGEMLEEADKENSVPPETTELHKFDLTETGPVYKASGSVIGNLGWKSDKKSFRMSEYEGVLRIATSLGDTWNETSTTRLTLLKENEQGVLTETAHIDHIGETGEQLYASRFVGHRGYLVTFRVTDPLYVFDLSDPENPFMSGELHIDGYSDYLHPVSETLLLGIGKDAVPDDASDDFGGRGAWYQGVKLSLFNISDPANPEEVSSLVIGRRGTDSDALYDHHALAWLPHNSGGTNISARLALPVQLFDTVPDYDRWCEISSPWCPYDWTHTGLYLFEISESAVINTGKMVVESRDGGDEQSWSWKTDRAVLLNDSVHYIREGKVWSADWESPDDMAGPE